MPTVILNLQGLGHIAQFQIDKVIKFQKDNHIKMKITWIHPEHLKARVNL